MHIVALYGWQEDEESVAKKVAGILGILVFEARQKIIGGGPTVLASFVDPGAADLLAARLRAADLPVLVIDSEVVRLRPSSRVIRRFVFDAAALQVEGVDGDSFALDYRIIELLLVAACTAQTQTVETVTERKFSLGKTLLAGGLPMSKKVTREETVISERSDETLWLYAGGQGPLVFDRGGLNYDGLGPVMQLSRDRNFAYLKEELQRRAPQAVYDDRLLKRAGLSRLLGPALGAESNRDLAFELLAATLRAGAAAS